MRVLRFSLGASFGENSALKQL